MFVNCCHTQIEVETVDRTGTFLGSLWDSKTNMAVTLLEAGLARLQTSFGTDRIPDAHLLAQAEQSAKRQKLKVKGQKIFSNGLFSSSVCLIQTVYRYGRIMSKERKSRMVQQLLRGGRRKSKRC